MKKTTILLAIFAFISVSVLAQQGLVYTGAVPRTDGSNYYLVKDGYDKVFDFYAGAYGKPDNEGVTDDSKRSAFFVSDKNWKDQHSWKLDPPGVQITELQGNSQAVSRVFWALRGLIEMGFLTRARYEEIEKQYIGLKDHYYKPGEDEAIQKSYEQKLLEGHTEEISKEETMEKVQELVMAGRFQEATALAERMKDAIVDNLEIAQSEKAVDEWIRCLEEISAVKFPVIITVSQ